MSSLRGYHQNIPLEVFRHKLKDAGVLLFPVQFWPLAWPDIGPTLPPSGSKIACSSGNQHEVPDEHMFLLQKQYTVFVDGPEWGQRGPTLA